MENKWLNKAQSLLKRFDLKNDRKPVIFLICVGIATIFWFLNALEKEYTVELSFPVRYTNLPKNKVLSNTPPSHFILDVRSYGFTLLRYKLSVAFSPLVFNVNEFTGKIMEETNKPKYAIPSRAYRNGIASQLSNELNITGIQPDTVYFEFDRIISKKVKVVPDITYDLQKQHYLYDNIRVKPDSIKVTGPESILDTLPNVKTVSQHYKELDQITQRNVSLQEINKLEFEPKRVVVTIPIEEYTEKHITVPISVDSLPDSVHVNLFPSEVKISFMTGLSHFNEISPNDFRFSVSYNDLKNKIDYLPVRIDKFPPHLKSLNYLPQKVEYLIEK